MTSIGNVTSREGGVTLMVGVRNEWIQPGAGAMVSSLCYWLRELDSQNKKVFSAIIKIKVE